MPIRSEIIAVGTELLLGDIANTNATLISQRLAENGIPCYFHSVVGDNHSRIVDALQLAVTRSNTVIVTGGLGPTQDDITREALAEVMGTKLVRNQQMETYIRDLFAKRGRDLTENNLHQADVPDGAFAMQPTTGTAPGLCATIGECVVYALPGVPNEMEEMLERAVLPDIRRRNDENIVIKSRLVNTWGISESAVAEKLQERFVELDSHENLTMAFLASPEWGTRIRLTARAIDDDHAEKLLTGEQKLIESIIGDFVYGNDDETMESVVGALATARNVTIGAAESFTGGMLASRLVNVSGSSAWFRGGVVSYAREVKYDLLQVPEGPVVSEQAARAMAEGVCKALGCDAAVSTTGVAGPEPQEGKDAGTVFIGVSFQGLTEVQEYRLSGSRDQIRKRGTTEALNQLRLRLLDS